MTGPVYYQFLSQKGFEKKKGNGKNLIRSSFNQHYVTPNENNNERIETSCTSLTFISNVWKIYLSSVCLFKAISKFISVCIRQKARHGN